MSKIDKEKFGKILKSKKAMRKIMMAFLMCAVAFYGIAFMLGHFGIEYGTDIIMQWGNIFVLIVILIFAYEMFFFDEDFQKIMRGNKKDRCPKCKSKEYIVMIKPYELDGNPKEKRQCKKCAHVYDVEVAKKVKS